MEDAKVLLRDMGTIIQWSAVTFLVPLIVSMTYFESVDIFIKYLVIAIFAFTLGFVLRQLSQTKKQTDLRHAFLSISLLWLLYTALAALPFVLIQGASFVDGYFEAMSALTTTGTSIFGVAVGTMPLSLIFWRSFLSWIGGIGFIVLAMVGVLSTYSRAAVFLVASGTERLRPNLRNAVREFMLIYVILTAIGLVLLYASGMTFFDAVNYAMSAISTTGFSTTAEGLIGLHNPWINLSLMFIMLLGATSFFTHYLFIRKRQFNAYVKDPEFLTLIGLSALSALIILPKMVVFYQSDITGVAFAFFHTVSSITGGGLFLDFPANIFKWEDFIKLVLVAIMFIGGSAGSTCGGIKISRFLIFSKSVYWKLKSIILPEKTYFSRKFEDRTIEEIEVKEIMQFILLYMGFIILGVLVLTSYGYDLGNATFEVTSAQSNVGIETGIVVSAMPLGAKIILIINMLVGRLEIIPLMALVAFAVSIKPRLKLENILIRD